MTASRTVHDESQTEHTHPAEWVVTCPTDPTYKQTWPTRDEAYDAAQLVSSINGINMVVSHLTEPGAWVVVPRDERFDEPLVNSNGFYTDADGVTCADCGQEFSKCSPFQADGRVQRAHRRNCPENPQDVYEPMVCR